MGTQSPQKFTFSYDTIIALILLLVSVFLIYKNYQTPVTKKSYIINVYLYIFFSVLFVAIGAKYIASLEMINSNNYWKFLILYLVIGFGSIFVMIQSNFYYNHLGFLLFLLAMSLIIGMSVKNSKNAYQAALITGVIIIILTTLVYISSEERLIQMVSWLPGLTSVLCCLIIFEIIYLFFSKDYSHFWVFNIMAIILFTFFILSDTSKILLDSKRIQCQTHTCINYPWASSSLVLDYLNMFVNFLESK
jgi:FtsH-binding integral membrane protein